MNVLNLKLVNANLINTRDYGVFLGPDEVKGNLPIPYYDSVIEGENLPFHCAGTVTVRTSCIKKWRENVEWLERHLKITQAFIGLGDQPFVIVLGKPNHTCGQDKPILKDLKSFLFPAGHGIILHAGTWHDFPIAYDQSVTLFIINSKEVIDTLISTKKSEPLNEGDIYKINIREHLSVEIHLHRCPASE